MHQFDSPFFRLPIAMGSSRIQIRICQWGIKKGFIISNSRDYNEEGLKMTTVATNRQARHQYELFDKYEAGIALKGAEVKSLREGRTNLKGSFVRVMRGEAFLVNCHISPYSHIQDVRASEPTRLRKLLLKKSEIDRLAGQTARKGYTLVPLSIYFKKGLAKVEIAVARGKREFDKRETLKRRIAEREASRAIRGSKS